MRHSKFVSVLDSVAAAVAAPTWQNNGTWSAADLPFSNTPTLGSERLTDGALENWLSATNLTSWTESIAGTSTINQETSDVHGGGNAARMDIDASNSTASIRQNTLTTAGNWYLLTLWAKSNIAAKTLQPSGTNFPFTVAKSAALTTSYAQYSYGERASGTDLLIGKLTGTSASLYVDDISLKLLTMNTLYNVRSGPSMPASIAATGTISLGVLAGVVYGLDSLSAPANLIQAVHDGGTALRLEKLVAGTWTTVLTQTASYVSGQLPQIKYTGGTTFQLWYNGTQRGADQTISDAGTGLFHGVMSTSALNSITGVTVS